MAVDTLGHLLALHVTAADQSDRAQVEQLAHDVQTVTGESVELAYVDRGFTGDEPAQDIQQYGIHLEVVKFVPGQARFRAAAPPLGRRAQVRLGDALSPAGARLRALARNVGGSAFPSLCHPDAETFHLALGAKCLTRSRSEPRNLPCPFPSNKPFRGEKYTHWLVTSGIPLYSRHDRIASPERPNNICVQVVRTSSMAPSPFRNGSNANLLLTVSFSMSL
jgi:hypothetical protein